VAGVVILVGMTDSLSLRARKRQRTREAIIDAAMSLFAEHGFDGVSVDEIAARADVGRTTFFRYFGDKQEVLFADSAELSRLLTDAIDRAAAGVVPIGDSLDDALAVARAGVLALADAIAERATWMRLHDRLIAENAALTARQMLKERDLAQAAIASLCGHGASLETAMLAAGIGAACLRTAQEVTTDAPERLPGALRDVLDRLR
jgi:AcrR family transcriptional regulator